MIIIGEIEEPKLATSERSHCAICEKRIGKNTPRCRVLVRLADRNYPYAMYKFICYECADKRLLNDIKQFKAYITLQKRKRTRLGRLVSKAGAAIIMMKI